MRSKVCHRLAITLAILSGTPVAIAQKSGEAFCWPGREAVEIFRSGEWAEEDNYVEGIGAPVQREHPNTSLFAQIKYSEKGGAAFCQYSNHVGWVFMVYTFNVKIEKSNPCRADECRRKPYWRSEWAEDSPEKDKPGQTHLDVCVVDRDGLTFPSVGCPYIQPKWYQK